ncbi:MAG TPA: hypothetical protein VMD59_16315, partial [Acidimicrobiales bacterium]|nr:hypothetical protein [Acidimicrobiales bacterium]
LPPRTSLIGRLMTWDAWWYATIVVHGYSWNPHSAAQQNPAFFPLYPLAVVAGHLVTRAPDPYVAVVTSICAQAAAAAVLVSIVRRDGGSDRSALCWTVLFVVSPPAVFDIMGYYSALFCLLLFLAVQFAQQGRRTAAAAMVGLAGATNPIGIAFGAAFAVWLAVSALGARRPKALAALGARPRKALAALGVLGGQVLLAFSGILAYTLYLWAAFGDALAWYHANDAWSTPISLGAELRSLATLSPVKASITGFVTAPYGEQSFTFFLDCLAFAVVIACLVALLASKTGGRTFGFWALLAGLVFVQIACARVGEEASTTRFLLPVVLGAGAVSPGLRRFLTRPAVFVALCCVLAAGTVFFLQRLAVDQWID